MIYIEALMLSVMIYLGLLSSYTDIKYGIIKNKVLLVAAVIAVILDIIYYSVFAQNLFGIFIINTIALWIFSLLMYFHHIWSAGDSKMLMVESLLIPVELYNKTGELRVSSVSIIILIFSIAYMAL